MANIRELKWLHRWNNMQLQERQGRRKFGDWNEKERKFTELINWLHATCIKRRTWHFGRNNNKSLTFALAVTSDTLFLFHWAAFEGSQHWWLLFTAELSSLFISLFKFRTKKRGFSCKLDHTSSYVWNFLYFTRSMAKLSTNCHTIYYAILNLDHNLVQMALSHICSFPTQNANLE